MSLAPLLRMTTSQRFDIVVGVDLSEHADAVLHHAYDEALRHERPTLHVVTVSDDTERASTELAATVARTLDDAVPRERRADWSILVHVRKGNPEEQVVELAAETLADRIVVGRFGVAARHRRHVDSTADRIVALADCPVLVVPPPRDTSASDRQCPACVEVRRESGGEQWFCEAHHGEYLGRVILGRRSDEPRGTMW